MTAIIDGAPMVPKSLLNGLRRDLVARLDALAGRRPDPANRGRAGPSPRCVRPLGIGGATKAARPRSRPSAGRPRRPWRPSRRASRTIYLEFQDIKPYREAVEAVRRVRRDASIFLATPRIEKPGEANLFRFLARQGADGLLVRNAGGMAFCAENGLPFVADFSLNAANELTVGLLQGLGASA